jgi:hypothetical protein
LISILVLAIFAKWDAAAAAEPDAVGVLKYLNQGFEDVWISRSGVCGR